MSYIKSHGMTVNSKIELPIKQMQPSQLYISEEKLRCVREWFNPEDKENFEPIPIKIYDGSYLMTDGHTRITMAVLAGWESVPVVWDDDPLDMLAYALNVEWCKEEGINDATGLTKRIIPHKEYETLWLERCYDMKIQPTFAAIVARFGGLDGRHRVIILTDNAMYETACLIKTESEAFVKHIEVINLDEPRCRTDSRLSIPANIIQFEEEGDYSAIYSLAPDDLLILHIGIESWVGKHKKIAYAFSKPENVSAKYICIRPTITASALLEGLNTPEEVTEAVLKRYGNLQSGKMIRVTSKSGTDISIVPSGSWTIPFVTHKPGANAYLPPAEISHEVELGSANGIIVADVTVGELRVYADLIEPFGIVDMPVKLYIENGEITDITGGDVACRLKAELWKLPDSCRKIIELGIGLSSMTPTGIIGIDECIAGTCHFGIGDGSGNTAPIHLDVVVGEFSIE